MQDLTKVTSYLKIVSMFSMWLFDNESHLKTLSGQEAVKSISNKWSMLTWAHVDHSLLKLKTHNIKPHWISYPESEE
jgi:hypothetical protein